jgi:hypothetical protein
VSIRYTLGRGGADEPGLTLIADADTGHIIARSSELALPDLRELVRLANAGWEAEQGGPEPNPAHEELARNYRTSRPAEEGPEGTRESLERCARMLDTHAPDCFPANDKGQVHFARAIMESVADEIKAYLGAHPESGKESAP